MRAGTKVGGFLAGLVLVGAVGAGVGALAGPVDTEPSGHDDDAGHEGTGGTDHDDDHREGSADDPHAGHEGTGDTEPAEHDEEQEEPADDPHPGHDDEAGDGAGEAAEAAGTSATQDGYRLALEPTDADIRFRILDPEGAPVVDTEVVHEKPLHLILVGRSRWGYAHLHPEVAADGTWSVARPDLAPDAYRVVADLRPAGGPELVLAGDLTVPGAVEGRAVPEPSTTATVDGLTVTMDGHPEVGEVELSFALEGADPEPYLDTRGHLVAFRAGDLAYSHVHPHDGDDGPVRFTASFPSEGTYRLYLDLRVDGVVRTFDFTVEVHGHGH